MGDRGSEEPNGARVDEAALADPYFKIHALEGRQDRKFMRYAVVAAALVHISLLLLRMPQMAEFLVEDEEPELFVVKPVRFRPPPPAPQPEIPRLPVRVVPVPDPTPDELEPLLLAPIEQLPTISSDQIVYNPPEPPPPPSEPAGPVYLVGDMTPPVKLHAPPPHYTEVARRARLEGVVIVQAVIDKQGSVASVKLLKGLPLGLDQAAVEAIKRWRFEPARLADGRAAMVYYTLTVKFELQ